MAGALYYLVYYLFRLIGLLPLRVLYIISDMIYYLAYYIVKYRRDVVFENLRNAFPEKGHGEIKEIAKRFYSHLCDLLVEIIYQSGMGGDEISRRVRYNNPEIIEKYFNEGKHVAAVTDAHIDELEKLIRDQPEYWLWSHRRWKVKRNI